MQFLQILFLPYYLPIEPCNFTAHINISPLPCYKQNEIYYEIELLVAQILHRCKLPFPCIMNDKEQTERKREGLEERESNI